MKKITNNPKFWLKILICINLLLISLFAGFIVCVIGSIHFKTAQVGLSSDTMIIDTEDILVSLHDNLTVNDLTTEFDDPSVSQRAEYFQLRENTDTVGGEYGFDTGQFPVYGDDAIPVYGREKISKITPEEFERLTQFVYQIAWDDSFETQYALAECILNDVENDEFPNTIGGCIYFWMFSYNWNYSNPGYLSDANDDIQDCINEAVTLALTERWLPQDVIWFSNFDENWKPGRFDADCVEGVYFFTGNYED